MLGWLERRVIFPILKFDDTGADTGKSQTWCNVWPQIRTMASYSGLSPASLPANNNNNQHADQPRHSGSRVNTAFCACACKWNICLLCHIGSNVEQCYFLYLLIVRITKVNSICVTNTRGRAATWTDICALSHWKGNNMKHEIKGLAQVLNSILSIGF